MAYYNVTVFCLVILLIISIFNYLWLSNKLNIVNTTNQSNYLGNLNVNKYNNVGFKTYTYIYSKNLKTDKCYSDTCDINANLIEEKIKSFHNELYNLSNNKLLVLENQFNIAPLTFNTDDLKVISLINK